MRCNADLPSANLAIEYGQAARRGLTLLELVLALSITAIIAAAVAGMMHTVTTGIMTRRDNRESMIRANAAQTRLAAYVTSSRCILDHRVEDAVLWLDDSRRSETVHASEIRWIRYDAQSATVVVDFVDFPAGWSDLVRALEDREYDRDASWWAIRTSYASRGMISTFTLVDAVASMRLEADAPDPLRARHLCITVEFVTGTGTLPIMIASGIRTHEPPHDPLLSRLDGTAQPDDAMASAVALLPAGS